jgi:hypothetical protein
MLLRVPKGEALIEMGNAYNQVIQDCRLYEPRWVGTWTGYIIIKERLMSRERAQQSIEVGAHYISERGTENSAKMGRFYGMKS